MEIMTDDIEQAYASAVEQSQEPEKNKETGGEETQTTAPTPEEVISAPASYKQEYKDSFGTLPREWQKYLASREKEMEQGLSRARNEYNWVNNAYNARKEALAAQGYSNAQEYFETLIGIADALDKNPETTIAQLQALYNVGAANDNTLQKQMNSLAAAQNEMRNYLQNVQNERIKSEFAAFLNAKDENGNLKHPYFAEVKEEMAALFNAGLAKNYEDAYARAVWQVEGVRNKIMAEKTKAEIAAKANDAKSAKAKAFNPTSKADGTTKELSLEEEIALNFDKFNGA